MKTMKKREKLIQQLKEIDDKNASFYLNINAVFEELKKDAPVSYEEIKVKGRNAHQMMFVSDNILFTVEQDLAYNIESVVGCRISIKRKELKKL